MFADDLKLIREVAAKYGPIQGPIVDVGGLRRPCVANYQKTIDAMEALRKQCAADGRQPEWREVAEAQHARYENIDNPLGFLGDVIIENPATGGAPIEELWRHYPHAIGTAVVLSTLEHVRNPFAATEALWSAMKDGGLIVVSTPWTFPHHPSPEDNFRFSPTGLRYLFHPDLWNVLEHGWRLRIPADAGVLCTRTGKPQAVESSYLVARAR